MSPESHPSYTDDDRDTDAALAGLRNLIDIKLGANSDIDLDGDSDTEAGKDLVVPFYDRGNDEPAAIPLSIAQRSDGSWVVISRTVEIEGREVKTIISAAPDMLVQSVLAQQAKQ